MSRPRKYDAGSDRAMLLSLLIDVHDSSRCACLEVSLHEAVDPADSLESIIGRLWRCHYGIEVDNAP